jgi:hydroxymethylglutaryl-CoA lyase
MNFPKVFVHEECMREGMQIESTAITVDEKVRLLGALSDTGLRSINVGSFVSPRYTPQMADIDDVLARFIPRPDVRYYYLAMNAKGHQRAAHWPFLQARDFPPMLVCHLCDTFVRRNANRSQDDEMAQWPAMADAAVTRGAPEGGIGVNAAWGSNFEGLFDLDRRLAMLRHEHEVWKSRGIPVTWLLLGDPMSWCMPHEVEETLEAVAETWPEIRTIYLHLHDARGMALPSIYAALRCLGPDRVVHIDTTAGGIGGCPYCGNGRATGMAATEDVVGMLEGMGLPTGVDLEALIEVVWQLEELIGRSVPGHVAHAGPRPGAGRLYDPNLALVETHAEARHFRMGTSVIEHDERPWPVPIPEPRRHADVRQAHMALPS